MKIAVSSVASAALLGLALVVAPAAQATEGGGSIYAPGAENFACCALPPPGVYAMGYAQLYRATELKDNAGNALPVPGFKVTASAISTRLIWVTGQQVAGASLAWHVIVPVVSLDVNVGGASQRKNGVGDLVFGPALGWHFSPQLHGVLALDVDAPTGAYRRGDLANIGRNYWATQLVAGVSWIDPAGLNADTKTMYTWNAKNEDTNYRSGQELIIDYAAGWGLGNGLTLGAGGHLYRQTTDDRSAGAVVADNKGRALAIGPSARYDSGKGWFATLKYETDTGVRNRAAGKALWLKVVVPI